MHLSNDICVLPAIRLGSMIIRLSLPHAWNGRLKAMTWWGPVPGIGREEPDAFPVNGHSTRKATKLADFRGLRKVLGAHVSRPSHREIFGPQCGPNSKRAAILQRLENAAKIRGYKTALSKRWRPTSCS